MQFYIDSNFTIFKIMDHKFKTSLDFVVILSLVSVINETCFYHKIVAIRANWHPQLVASTDATGIGKAISMKCGRYVHIFSSNGNRKGYHIEQVVLIRNFKNKTVFPPRQVSFIVLLLSVTPEERISFLWLYDCSARHVYVQRSPLCPGMTSWTRETSNSYRIMGHPVYLRFTVLVLVVSFTIVITTLTFVRKEQRKLNKFLI